MATILITAYAVNPYKGSEDGSGWNFICQAARFHQVIALTRENNAPEIERYLSENPEEFHQNLRFLYFDLPYWMRFWKKKNKGALLYFYLWQMAMPAFIKRQNIDYDLVHNLNFHNDWTPTFLYKLNKPLIWGPMEHHPAIPKQFIKPIYGTKAWLYDRLFDVVKNSMRKYNPVMRKALRKTDLAIAGHSGVIKKMPVHPKQTKIMSLVGAESRDAQPQKRGEQFTVLSVGRFVPLKGFDVTIKVFARFYHQLPKERRAKVRLLLVGRGPLKNYLKKLGEAEKLGDSLQIIEWLPVEALMKLYRQSQVFFFPSHEGAGMVVVEALSFGLPVLCFSNKGPGELVNDTCAFTVPYSRYENSISFFEARLFTLYADQQRYEAMSKAAIKTFNENYLWDKKGNKLSGYYTQVLETHKK